MSRFTGVIAAATLVLVAMGVSMTTFDVSEFSTLAILGLGLAGLGLIRRKQSKI